MQIDRVFILFNLNYLAISRIMLNTHTHTHTPHTHTPHTHTHTHTCSSTPVNRNTRRSAVIRDGGTPFFIYQTNQQLFKQ